MSCRVVSCIDGNRIFSALFGMKTHNDACLVCIPSFGFDSLFSINSKSNTKIQTQSTDRAARGVDFDEAPVNHCVVFDFPKDPAEYIRRVGRTARAGRIGTSTVFAYGWQLPIARNVMGKKLDSFTIATSDMKYDENDYEPRFDRRTKKRRDAQMKEKIENGTLWE